MAIVDGAGELVEVTDADDPRIADYRDLVNPGARVGLEAERGIIVIEGRVAVRQLVASEHLVRSLLVDDHQVTLAGDLVAAVLARGAPVYVAPREVVAATVGFALHRGVVAVAQRPDEMDARTVLAGAARQPGADSMIPMIAVLEGLNDYENIGALFRNTAAFGAAAVLLDPTCADPLYRRSIRVSVGHALRVPFARLAPWPEGLDQVRSAGFLVAAMVPHPGQPPHLRAPPLTLAALKARLASEAGRGPSSPTVGVALVLGAEGPGLSPGALAAADETVTIPMARGVDSLNVATAAAVAFHRLSGD